MSTIGKQEALDTSPSGEWELVGRDMIRTKRAADGSGGMIVAQFWSSPTPEHARLMVAAPLMLTALKDALRFMEDAEVKALVGDEGCLWPVEEVRSVIAEAEPAHA